MKYFYIIALLITNLLAQVKNMQVGVGKANKVEAKRYKNPNTTYRPNNFFLSIVCLPLPRDSEDKFWAVPLLPLEAQSILASHYSTYFMPGATYPAPAPLFFAPKSAQNNVPSGISDQLITPSQNNIPPTPLTEDINTPLQPAMESPNITPTPQADLYTPNANPDQLNSENVSSPTPAPQFEDAVIDQGEANFIP